MAARCCQDTTGTLVTDNFRGLTLPSVNRDVELLRLCMQAAALDMALGCPCGV